MSRPVLYTLKILQGSSYQFEVVLKNTGGSALEHLAFTVEPVSGTGVTLAPSQALPETLQPGSQMKIGLICNADVSASAPARFTLKVHDVNGFERSMPVTVNVAAPQVAPKVMPQVFSMGMVAGDTRTQTITVANIGFATWTNVNVMNPTLSWIKVDGMTGLLKSLGSIPPGGNVSFTLKIEPPAEQASQAYAQNPLVELISDNFANVPVNAAVTITSARTANIYFNVTNADKLPTDPTRFIGGANVTLTSLDISGLSMAGKTDINGFVAFGNVPSGKYNYRVEATGANPVSTTIAIEPGVDQTMNILLPTSMVTYTWSVTPTTITDQYDITLDMTFKTDVPAPAIVVSPPLMSFAMEGGQTVYTQYTLKNKGLVSIMDFKLNTVQSDPAVTIELPFTTIDEIKPGQIITVPVKISLAHASKHEAKIGHSGGYTCAAGQWTNVSVEPLKLILGDTAAGGGSGGTGTTSSGGSGGGSSGGSSGNTETYKYSNAAGAVASTVVSNTTTTGACGMGRCLSNNDCGPCKMCNITTGVCDVDPAKAGFVANLKECGGQLCQKEVCGDNGATVCVDKTPAEKKATNDTVSSGLVFNDLESSKCSGRVNLPNPKGDQICTPPGENSPLIVVPPVPPILVPRECGHLDALTSCKIHDNEYGTCGTSHFTANNNLLLNLITECGRAFKDDYACIDACITVAGAFYAGVQLASPFYYPDSHRKGCRCCPGEE